MKVSEDPSPSREAYVGWLLTEELTCAGVFFA
jgi:hypothetical protein